MTETRTDAVAVEDGAVPIWVAEPADAANLPARWWSCRRSSDRTPISSNKLDPSPTSPPLS
ncbi:MAG: hypothetical protein R2710_07215 [Acidimicrobiales bacterium]